MSLLTMDTLEDQQGKILVHTSNDYERPVSSIGHQRQHLGNNYIEMLKISFDAVKNRLLDY